MVMASEIAREAQKLSTDRLVKLYTIDASELGGTVFNFISSIDTTMQLVSLTHVGAMATANTLNAHTLENGDSVRIANADQPEYNGDFTVTVVDPDTFTFTMAGTPASDATGTYLTATRLNNVMKFDDVEYAPVAIDVNGFEWNGQGTMPTPSLQISNVNRILMASVITLNDLVGAKFTRIRTFRKHLDDGDDPDPTMIFPKEVYRINRKVAQNKIYMEFQLASALDQEGVKIPGRQCLRNTCTHRYRVWNATTLSFDYTRATCPYVGGTYFTGANVVTVDPAEDRCSKQLTGCGLRFGNAPLPTRAIPGIGGR